MMTNIYSILNLYSLYYFFSFVYFPFSPFSFCFFLCVCLLHLFVIFVFFSSINCGQTQQSFFTWTKFYGERMLNRQENMTVKFFACSWNTNNHSKNLEFASKYFFSKFRCRQSSKYLDKFWFKQINNITFYLLLSSSCTTNHKKERLKHYMSQYIYLLVSNILFIRL